MANKPPYKPGDLVVYESEHEYALLRVIKIARVGNRPWQIYVGGMSQPLREQDLKPYVEAE